MSKIVLLRDLQTTAAVATSRPLQLLLTQVCSFGLDWICYLKHKITTGFTLVLLMSIGSPRFKAKSWMTKRTWKLNNILTVWDIYIYIYTEREREREREREKERERYLSPRIISNIIHLKYLQNRLHQFKLFQFFTSPISIMFKKGTREFIHMATYLGLSFWHLFLYFNC